MFEHICSEVTLKSHKRNDLGQFYLYYDFFLSKTQNLFLKKIELTSATETQPVFEMLSKMFVKSNYVSFIPKPIDFSRRNFVVFEKHLSWIPEKCFSVFLLQCQFDYKPHRSGEILKQQRELFRKERDLKKSPDPCGL